jgi:hypothetical protein
LSEKATSGFRTKRFSSGAVETWEIRMKVGFLSSRDRCYEFWNFFFPKQSAKNCRLWLNAKLH